MIFNGIAHSVTVGQLGANGAQLCQNSHIHMYTWQASIDLTFHVFFVSADYAVKSIKWSNTETVRLHVSHSLALVHVGIYMYVCPCYRVYVSSWVIECGELDCKGVFPPVPNVWWVGMTSDLMQVSCGQFY